MSRRSRWRFGVYLVPVYVATTLLVAGLGRVGAFASPSDATVLAALPDGLGIALGLLFVAVLLFQLVGSVLVPVVFPVATFLDARAVREAAVDWSPDPRLYGGLALVQLGTIRSWPTWGTTDGTPTTSVVYLFTFGLSVAYLYNRRQCSFESPVQDTPAR